MKRLALITVALFLLGSDCGGIKPPPGPNAYCAGAVVEAEPTMIETAVNAVSGLWSTIIGGEVSVDRRATVQVLLPGGYCSGTVIGTRTVLTAAHCKASTVDILIDGQRLSATRIIPHPDYTGGFPYNDLMILQFNQDLPGPVVSTVYESGTPGCSELVAQGFGKSEFNEPATLRESRYSVWGEDAMVLHTKQATWGGACFGDSGSALYAVVDGDLQIAGVLSTTYTQDCLVGNDYVNLRFFRPWLEENTL